MGGQSGGLRRPRRLHGRSLPLGEKDTCTAPSAQEEVFAGQLRSMIFCPDCGKGIEATFKFCPYCGKPFPTEEHEGSQTFVKPFMPSSRALQQISSALPLKAMLRTSLVAQWLRMCLPVQGTWVGSLVWEDPTLHGAIKPMRHNY